MAFKIKDRVKEVTTTTGTGAVALSGASATFDTFQSYMSNGDTTYYAIVHTATGVDEWEVGLGTWNTGNTLTRTTVLAGSNGTSAVTFGSGNKDVFMTYPASKAALASEDVTFTNITVTGNVDGRDVAADGTKLDTVETNADVTDTANVTSSGALMRSGGTMTGNLVLNADPSAALGAATKQYVDTIAAAGVHYHDPVRVSIATNLPSAYANGSSGVGATLTNSGTQAAIVIDGVSLVVNDRVLIKGQTNARHNGVYKVTTVGNGSTNWVITRTTDTDSYGASDKDALGEGDAFFVSSGSVNGGALDVMNVAGAITFGTTEITFVHMLDTTIYSAGTGLTLTGTEFAAAQDISTSANPQFGTVTANLTGNVSGTSGSTTGNAATATALATARTIAIAGDVVGSATFDGSANISITAAVQDDSHAHVITNVDGLQTALDAKTNTSRDLIAGNGLTGGGDLTVNRTFAVGAGTGITVNANDVAHGSTSSQASLTALTGAAVVSDIDLDGFGHVTNLTTRNMTLANLGYTGETNATADQTAAQLLTAIKTVDGTGTGLDADLLDGQHGSYYYAASNPSGYTTNTGTVTEGGTSFSGTYPVTVRTAANQIYSNANITFSGATNTLTAPTFSGALSGNATTATLAATVADNVIDADNLKVTGNGTTSQWLRSDGDGSFTWATPPNTVYTLPSIVPASVFRAASGTDNGFEFWNGSTYYIKMGNNQANHGTVTDYSMHFSMGTTVNRGFTFGSTRTAVAASINALTGAAKFNGNLETGGTLTVLGASTFSGNVQVSAGDTLIVGGTLANNGYNSVSSSTIYLGGGNDRVNYSIGTLVNDYGGAYTKLDLRWHTGIRMFAMPQYGGMRYFTDSAMNTEIFSIGRGDSNVRIVNNLIIAGTVDGRDVSTDGTKLDTIATSANNYSFPYTVSNSAGSSTVVQRDGNGYIFANYFNSTDNDVATGDVGGIICKTSNDYHRTASAAAVRSFINVANGANAYSLPAIPSVTSLNVADKITHTGDTNTYIQFDAADQFRVVTGGIERLEVNNTQITSVEPIHAPSFHGDGSNLTGVSGGLPLSGGTLTGDLTIPSKIIHSGDTDTYILFNSDQFQVYTGGTERVRINNTYAYFNRYVSAPYFEATSDIKLKTDIKKIVSPLEMISNLNGYTFNWKDSGKASAGVIAQEVEKVLPSAVSENEEGSKSVNYNELIGVLIEAVKEQQVQINSLKKMVGDN